MQPGRSAACRRPTVATRLGEAIEDVTLLIDGTPERAPLALEGDEALVQRPMLPSRPCRRVSRRASTEPTVRHHSRIAA